MSKEADQITSVQQLLALHDAEFIQVAYESVLGRPPDPKGEAHYLGWLRSGCHKLEILDDIRHSPEGRSYELKIHWLDQAIRQHRRANLPVLGAIIRLLTGAEGNSANDRRLRRAVNDIGRLQKDLLTLDTALQKLGPNLKRPPELNPGSSPIEFGSQERRIFAKLRLFARMRGSAA